MFTACSRGILTISNCHATDNCLNFADVITEENKVTDTYAMADVYARTNKDSYSQISQQQQSDSFYCVVGTDTDQSISVYSISNGWY